MFVKNGQGTSLGVIKVAKPQGADTVNITLDESKTKVPKSK